MKKLNVVKQKEIWDFLGGNYLPTRQIKYKVINVASSNKSIMANKLFQLSWNDF